MIIIAKLSIETKHTRLSEPHCQKVLYKYISINQCLINVFLCDFYIFINLLMYTVYTHFMQTWTVTVTEAVFRPK